MGFFTQGAWRWHLTFEFSTLCSGSIKCLQTQWASFNNIGKQTNKFHRIYQTCVDIFFMSTCAHFINEIHWMVLHPTARQWSQTYARTYAIFFLEKVSFCKPIVWPMTVEWLPWLSLAQLWSSCWQIPITDSKGNQNPRIKTRYRKLS